MKKEKINLCKSTCKTAKIKIADNDFKTSLSDYEISAGPQFMFQLEVTMILTRSKVKLMKILEELKPTEVYTITQTPLSEYLERSNLPEDL